MASEGIPAAHFPTPGKAKTYNRIKLLIGIASSLMSFALMVWIVLSGVGRDLALFIRGFGPGTYAAFLLFAFAVGTMQTVLTLPLGFYSGYILEHRFGLSNQTIGRWAWEHIKGLSISLPIGISVLVFLYFCLERYGNLWWLPVGIALTALTVVLARLAPVIIMPLFYKFTPISEGSLRDRIMHLCSEAGLRVEGVFTFDLSKNTKKANAGFTGIGKSKRIILGDTLVREFTEEEIETVFAHELGHYTHHHISIGIVVGIVSTFAGLGVTALLYAMSIQWLGYSAPTELAALPLLAIWLSLFGLVTSPLGNMLSRHHERQADRYAVVTTGNKAAFISALRRLEAMNLADPQPHPVVEFLFYSHPPIAKRILAAETV